MVSKRELLERIEDLEGQVTKEIVTLTRDRGYQYIDVTDEWKEPTLAGKVEAILKYLNIDVNVQHQPDKSWVEAESMDEGNGDLIFVKKKKATKKVKKSKKARK